MFNKCKCCITFYKCKKDGETIADSSIFAMLANIREKYNFQIVSCKLHGSTWASEIIIKCNKKEKQSIIFSFIGLINDWIECIEIV